jgi:hypothetical protein
VSQAGQRGERSCMYLDLPTVRHPTRNKSLAMPNVAAAAHGNPQYRTVWRFWESRQLGACGDVRCFLPGSASFSISQKA